MTDIDKESRPSIGTDKAFEAAAKALHQNWTPAGVHALIDAADAFCARFAAPAVQAVGERREIEILRMELAYARAKFDRMFKIMMSVYGLAPSGENITLADGSVVWFKDPNAAETLHMLGRAIHAIPAKLAEAAAIQPPPSAEPAPFAYVTADHKMLIFADNVAGITDDPGSLEPLFRGAKQSADPRPVVGIVDERHLKAPSTLGEQVKRAQAEIGTWSPEERAAAHLEGGDKRPGSLYEPIGLQGGKQKVNIYDAGQKRGRATNGGEG